jgi:ribosomal-protein-alanine N-acetyltransferase
MEVVMPLLARFKLNNVENVFNDYVELETEDYKLRKLNKNDARDIVDIYENKDIMTYDRALFIKSESKARKFIEELNDMYEDRERIDWAIEDKKLEKVIGLVALFNISVLDSRAEVGYVLNKDYTNKGIMQYILRWIVDFSFNFLGIHKLEANINAQNAPSIKICEKIGFEREGCRKKQVFDRKTGEYNDNYTYGLINESWEIILEKIE